MIHLIADQAIPYLSRWQQPQWQLTRLPASKITSAAVAQADALLVRTKTPINQALLQDSRVRWVGSATSGIDHIDQAWLQQQNIRFCHAPGCNAKAVLEYVVACFQALGSPKHHGRIGVIGCGHIGGLVASHFRRHGYEVLCYDPPKAAHDSQFISCCQTDLTQLDALCIHAALHHDQPHASTKLVDYDLLQQQHDGTIIIQASRGEIADETALCQQASRLPLCLDVWCHEPNINRELLSLATIATPHIAGYAIDSKFAATRTVMQSFCRDFQLTPPAMTPASDNGHPLHVGQLTQQLQNSPHLEATFETLRQQETMRTLRIIQ